MFLPKPISKDKLNSLISSLIDYFSLSDYEIIWDDGERSIPEIWMLHPKRRFTYFALLSLYQFATRYTEGKKVLDFGCGVGYGSYYLASRGAKHVVGIEIDEKSHKYGRDRYVRENMTLLDKDIESMAKDPNNTGAFDVIYCSNVMEHIADYKQALLAVKKMLAPNGLYIQITPPSGKARGNPYHVTNFTVPEWREILDGYFVDQKYFSHNAAREREDTENEFDFTFAECLADETRKNQSISGIIVARNPSL